MNERGYPEINSDAVTKGKWELGESHFITQGLPLDLLPEGNTGGSFYQYKAQGTVLIKSGEHPVLAVKNFGKGRVVAMAYGRRLHSQSINPNETKNFLGLLGIPIPLLRPIPPRAAGRETPVSIESLVASNSGLKLLFRSQAKDQCRLKSPGETNSVNHSDQLALISLLPLDQTRLLYRRLLCNLR